MREHALAVRGVSQEGEQKSGADSQPLPVVTLLEHCTDILRKAGLAPGSKGGSTPPPPKAPKELRLSSFNCRSAHRRGEALVRMMSEKKIDILLLQEAKIAANNLPEGYPESTRFRCHSTPNIRGLMILLSEGIEDSVEDTDLGNHQNLLWVKVNNLTSPGMVGNVYFSPLEEDSDENESTLQTLQRDLKTIKERGESAWIAVGGDLNFDPFKKKGINGRIFSALTATCELDCAKRNTQCRCGMRCVPRPNGRSYSRPESFAHMDNFLVNYEASRRIEGPLEYVDAKQMESFKGARKNPSDHIPVVITIAVRQSKRPKKSTRTVRRPNLAKLRRGDSET